MYPLSSSGQQNLGAVASMVAISCISVILRFGVRLSTGQGLQLSDWLILLALILMLAYSGVMIQYIVSGPGRGSLDFTELLAAREEGHSNWLLTMLKSVYVEELIFVATLSATKLSINAFYQSIFSISTHFRRWNIAATVLCSLWFIVFIFLDAFQCSPINALWNYMGSHCFASGKLWLGLELTNLFMDVMLLVMPFFVIKHLNLQRIRKYSLGGIFLLGGLVCIASILKLYYVWNPADPAFVHAGPTMVWSSIQLGIAILCACLPTLAPLLRLIREKLRLSTSPSGSNTYDKSNRLHNLKRGGNTIHSSYYRVQENQSHIRTKISNDSEEYSNLEMRAVNSIHVTRTIDIV